MVEAREENRYARQKVVQLFKLHRSLMTMRSGPGAGFQAHLGVVPGASRLLEQHLLRFDHTGARGLEHDAVRFVIEVGLRIVSSQLTSAE